jgi:hypothetical protein
MPMSIEAETHVLPHEEDETRLQALFPMLLVVPPLKCDDIMDDDLMRQDQTFGLKNVEEEVEEDETDDTEINDDPELDLEWPLGKERTDADVLWGGARDRVVEIMNQFGVPQEEREEIHGLFEWYLTGALRDLGFSPIPDQNRFAWRLRLSNPRWRFIADLGERLDALVSSEAITERTNGVMRRMIAPQRMRMGHRMLLWHLNVARHDK